MIYPSSHSQLIAEPGFKPRSVRLRDLSSSLSISYLPKKRKNLPAGVVTLESTSETKLISGNKIILQKRWQALPRATQSFTPLSQGMAQGLVRSIGSTGMKKWRRGETKGGKREGGKSQTGMSSAICPSPSPRFKDSLSTRICIELRKTEVGVPNVAHWKQT